MFLSKPDDHKFPSNDYALLDHPLLSSIVSIHSYSSQSTTHLPSLPCILLSCFLLPIHVNANRTPEPSPHKLSTQLLYSLLSLFSPSPYFSISSNLLVFFPHLSLSANLTQPSSQPSATPTPQLTLSLRLSNNQRPSLTNGRPSGQCFHLLTFPSRPFSQHASPDISSPPNISASACPFLFSYFTTISLPPSSSTQPPQAAHV